MNIKISAFGMLSSLGKNPKSCAYNLFSQGLPQLTPWQLKDGSTSIPVMEIKELGAMPSDYGLYDCRNNRLAYEIYKQVQDAIQDCIDKYGANRIGVVLGSSTSGIDATEAAFEVYRQMGKHPGSYSYHTMHTMGSLSKFIASIDSLLGPCYTISTACSSSARAMISAAGLIDMGVCDAVITGGVDTLCHLTVNGFSALGQTSSKRTNPMSINRDGLNIGEGGAFFVLEKGKGSLEYCGGGESMDAHHMSAPHPEGRGAKMAMEAAIEVAGITPSQVTYINMHGTGTKANDSMESFAIKQLFDSVYCSSTKPFTGHCLGASGAIEAAICLLSLQNENSYLPPHMWDKKPDEKIAGLNLVEPFTTYSKEGEICFLSNSFAFGGSNCSIILKKSRVCNG